MLAKFGWFWPRVSTVKETILNSSDDEFIPLEAVINLKDGEIVDNIHDIEGKIVPGPELGDVGLQLALEAKDVWKDLWKII